MGSESCRRREQAALDFCALSGLDRDRARIRDNDAGLTVFACSGCIVQFLSSRKPVLELHLLMVSESVASYRLVVVLSSASARDFGGVLRAGYSSVGMGDVLRLGGGSGQTNATPVSTSSPSSRLLFR